jgi:hypothetical protein
MIIEGQSVPQERKELEMRYVAFDVAEDYGSASRTLEATIVVESELSRVELEDLAWKAIKEVPGAAKRLLAQTETFIAYTTNGTDWVCWDTENLVKRPKGGTSLNRKFTRTKCKSYPKNDHQYRLTYLLNLVKFLKNAQDYEDLDPEEKMAAGACVTYVRHFCANPTIESVTEEQKRFHAMAKA